MRNDHTLADDDLGLDVTWEAAPVTAPPPVTAPAAGALWRSDTAFRSARELSQRLRGLDAPRCKTGLVFWPESLWRDPRGVAAALDAAPVSLCARLLDRLPAEARAAPFDVEGLFNEISAIADERTGGDVAWVFDVDVPLAKLPGEERERFWEAAFDRLPYRARALLLALPLLDHGPFAHGAHESGHNGGLVPGHPLGPSRALLLHWRDAERLAVLTPQRATAKE